MPKHIYTYPIAQPEHEPPVPLRRYGFHGLSYANILKQVTKYLNKPVEKTNIIICHLGSGASMCVIKDGKSLDTSVSDLNRLRSFLAASADLDSNFLVLFPFALTRLNLALTEYLSRWKQMSKPRLVS